MNSSLRHLRQLQALSQRDLAARAGVSLATVNRIEMGLRRPFPSTLRKLAKALGVSPSQLLSEQLPLME